MTDILLIKPSPPKKFMPYPPLGLGYIASVLREHGIPSKILNLEIDAMGDDEFTAYIKNENPRIVGFSCMTSNFPSGIKFASLAKKANPDIVTVFGGAHPTFQAEVILDKYKDVDIVVVREGEYSFLEIAQKTEKGESLSTIDGIYYRDDGKIVKTAARPYIMDLDSLPYPTRDLMELHKYHENVKGCINSSRGCPWSCLYCSTSQLHGHRYRTHSAKYVVDEVQIIVEEYDCRKISFADDLFTFDRKRVFEICDILISRGLHKEMMWGCSVRADTIDKEMLVKMREGGCTALFIGIETLDEHVMKTIRKKLNLDRVKDTIKLVKGLGFDIKASFILGLPFQKPEEGEAIMNFAREAEFKTPHDIVTVNMLCPFPGTDLYDNPGKYGMKIVNENWTLYNGLNCVTESETFPREQIIDAYMKLMEKNLNDLRWSKVEYAEGV